MQRARLDRRLRGRGVLPLPSSSGLLLWTTGWTTSEADGPLLGAICGVAGDPWSCFAELLCVCVCVFVCVFGTRYSGPVIPVFLQLSVRSVCS